MSSFKTTSFFMLYLLRAFYSVPNAEPCVVPDKTTSGIIASENCRKNLVDDKSICDFDCGGKIQRLTCHQGLFYKVLNLDEQPVNINTICKKNCDLGVLPDLTSVLNNCYKWDFAGQICKIYCPYKEELAAITCSGGILSHADEALSGPVMIPEKCPNAECFVSTPTISREVKGVDCVSSTKCFYECNVSYEIAKDAEKTDGTHGILRCESGVWSIPKCEKKCFPLPTVTDGFYVNRNCKRNKVSTERVCEFLCRKGFIPRNNAPLKTVDGRSTPYIRCNNQGFWRPFPDCIENRVCEQIPIFEPGTNVKLNECFLADEPESCHFFCSSGRVKPGTATRIFSDKNLAGTVNYSGIIKCDHKGWEKPVCEPETSVEPKTDDTEPELDGDEEKKESTTEEKPACETETSAEPKPDCGDAEKETGCGGQKFLSCPKLDNHVGEGVYTTCDTSSGQNHSTVCVIRCRKGIFLSLGSNETNLECENGNWMRIIRAEESNGVAKEHLGKLVCGSPSQFGCEATNPSESDSTRGPDPSSPLQDSETIPENQTDKPKNESAAVIEPPEEEDTEDSRKIKSLYSLGVFVIFMLNI